ncbi:M20/M25/M40 family metallo-hydrolase [Flavobacterium sp. Fl-318]|uniref:M20/M25/M40 family metallo-hydrolase n=1 Tax=Flavobacterium cupriresistens TaxID=2893885 RepID=A0ABU4RC80_9FLAO|nr:MULTISPECIES: M20/M25/M40 family metallo-hydrolase [unclassified Flavobacterium]MDX6189264.1 M20/M25/M40 family metallo-hydrolase [Flavobacterium sp. Fl-318]UFH41360.1 M20/M25/M40 family metallo-hydrolase [Flavobacterium sp. F-323]
MKKIIVSMFVLSQCFNVHGQSIDKIITTKEVTRIEKILSADDMQGRRTFTPGIEKASAFIESEFKEIGLKTFNTATNYRQEFSITVSKGVSSKITIDGKEINNNQIATFSYLPQVSLTEKSDISIVKINKGDNIGDKFNEYYKSSKNLLVLVDPSFDSVLPNIQHIDRVNSNPGNNTIMFVFGTTEATTFSVELTNVISKKTLNNVVGILPGKTKPNEYVIFSGHYDHLGIGSPQEGAPHPATDSIYNGANDDAAGTTAVIMLAKYFKKQNNNERTIIFTTFTAEEIGGYGAKYFSKQLAPEKVIAMFNIEMIGTESKWGKNSAYITGYEKSNMGEILQTNLKGSSFTFYSDPYPEQQLFYRSDNATLAKLGVPAHTISTSKMDNELTYHTADDEFETLDIDNMTQIIKSIALSSSSIISGKDTPTRVNTTQLK